MRAPEVRWFGSMGAGFFGRGALGYFKREVVGAMLERASSCANP